MNQKNSWTSVEKSHTPALRLLEGLHLGVGVEAEAVCMAHVQ